MTGRSIPRAAVVIATAALLAVVQTASSKHHPDPPRRGVEPQKVDESTALVSFVRQSFLMNDVAAYDIWDGGRYLGPLGASKLLQYKATPGEHLFMVGVRRKHIWAYMHANVVAGKEYFVKVNPVPLHFGAADARTDDRIDEWRQRTIDNEMSAKRKQKTALELGPEALEALAAFNNGTVSKECAAWRLSVVDGKKSHQPDKSFGQCVSLPELKPEFGY